MEQLYLDVANQWLYWLFVGLGILFGAIVYFKSRSAGKAIAMVLIGFALAAVSKDPQRYTDLLGRGLQWAADRVTFN
ncbi:TcpD family membrane protein [Streptococcus sp. H49]|uniref:TcpD family membrane protein n=1 Tax=Streptococcus huangxiaojuni TaxID=3237239 RepID=UPI0034A38559